jgi:hypothetical protein
MGVHALSFRPAKKIKEPRKRGLNEKLVFLNYHNGAAVGKT